MPSQTDFMARSASFTMGTGSFSGIKRPALGADHPPLFSAEIAVGLELCLCQTSVPCVDVSWVDLYLYMSNVTEQP